MAILLVAYGSANPGSRAELESFEKLCRTRFPHYPLRWAFSSATLRSRIAEKRQKSDSVDKAIMRLHFENFKVVAVQPLQTICGREHEAVVQSAITSAKKSGLACLVGSPLLASEAMIKEAAKALLDAIPAERKAHEEVIFMGHGARHEASRAYVDLYREIARLDPNVHVASMSGPISLEDILPRLVSGKVWLFPLLSVAGKHALQDMAGSGHNSWKNRIEQSGNECKAVLRGMAQWPEVSEIWLKSLGRVLKSCESRFGGKI